MGLFSSKPKKDASKPVVKKDIKETPAKDIVSRQPLAISKDSDKKAEGRKLKAQGVLIAPRITEKAGDLSQLGAYTFNVAMNATKQEIKKAIKTEYKVTPRKVSIIRMKPELLRKRGKKGKTKAFKKAVVFLNKGDKIELA